MYSAGLVLGFSMVATDNVRYDVEDAFAGAREVLQKLSSTSPRSEHYYDVLSRLADAITKHRQKRASESRLLYPGLVTELLTFDSGTGDRAGQWHKTLDTIYDYGADIRCPQASATSSMGSGLQSSEVSESAMMPADTATNGACSAGPAGPASVADEAWPTATDESWEAFAMQLSETFPLGAGYEQLFANA